MAAGKLEVFLISACDLKSSDIFGKSDPYAIIKFKEQSFESTTAKGQGSTPKWNQKFIFNFAEDNNTPMEEETMFVKIFDKDHFLGSDDFIGTARIPLATVLIEKIQGPNSYDVILPSGRVKGQVNLSMQFTPQL